VVRPALPDRVANQLRAYGKRVEYLLLEGEVHTIRHRANKVELLRSVNGFLGEHLGGPVCG